MRGVEILLINIYSFLAADSNSIRPNIVVSLLFVVVKIENSLLKLLTASLSAVLRA